MPISPRSLARAQPNRLKALSVPAPMGSINTISSGADMPPGDCILRYNMLAAEMGLRTRLGSREWVTGLDGPVRSLLPFTGSTRDGANNRLFACTQTGIWDVSASTAAPTRVLTFDTQNQDSGFGQSTVMVTAAGHFLCYADEANGYHVYSEVGATWAVGGLAGNPVTGVTPGNLVGLVPWKNRLWLIERDTGRGWYLGLGAVTGAATSFNFGGRFQAGGDLRVLASWTFDGGSGIDDALVAVSGGGDVLIYKGTDPALPGAFALQGVWSVDSVPAGRNFCTRNGGDLLIMSSRGLLPISKLVTGVALYDRSQYDTFKIANLFNQLQAATSNLRGWGMRLHPLDASLIVTVPVAPNQPTQQLAMSLTTKGWSQYRDLPMGSCAEPWGGTLYFGTEDGRVLANDGYVDGVTLADPNSYAPIQWSLLTAFSKLGTPQTKRIQQIVPSFLSQSSSPPYDVQARYRYDMSEIAAAPPSVPGGGASAWDTAKWDQAVWASGYTPSQQIRGAFGMGREVAIAIRGSATSRMVLVGFDIAYDVGSIR